VKAFVFAYGSLVDAGAMPAELRDHRRVWGVAMDNRDAIPGYKVYEEPTRERPRVLVAFLDVVEAPGTAVRGGLIPVDDQKLAALDERERQYHRIDVTDAVVGAPTGACVWTYRGRPQSRARVRAARLPVVVQRAYADAVASIGAPHPPFPLRDLVRVEV
jgi:gamma-glutamylcyclotransferase (GGCT)/AIG2-like uncharacterized protein YtfP